MALIAGPTASGKSDLAVALALRLEEAGHRASVINADSAQTYADLRVLSARPSVEEMQGVEHRLFGTWDGSEPCSAAQWATAAKREIGAAHEENIVPILCGGTGLYVRTLLDGIAPIPEIDGQIRAAVRALSQEQAREALLQEDPAAAARLAPADSQRTARALEVVRSTGRTLSEWQARKEGGIADHISLHPLILVPDRDWLLERCNRRFVQMMENGAIEEVETLLARRLDPDLPVMRAIGVPEIAAFLSGSIDLEEAIGRGQLATRQYAKRQFTWFRNQPPGQWPRADNKTIAGCDFFDRLLRQLN